MSVPTQAPAEVLILQPEPLGAGEADRTNRLDVAGETAKLLKRGGAGDATNKLRLPGGADGDPTAKLGASAAPNARIFDIELQEGQGIAPLVRAAETVLRQGNKHVVLDLSRFAQLRADELRMLVEIRKTFANAQGTLILSSLQRPVAAAIKALELDRELEVVDTPDQALERIHGAAGGASGRAERVSGLDLDVHDVEVGARRPDLSFAADFRRKGPEGLPRELVVMRCEPSGVSKVAQYVRQLSDKQLNAFVIDLGAVEQLEGSAIKELIKAQKHLEARGGHLAIANPREAVAGLMKVMGLDRDLPTFANRADAIHDYKARLLAAIDARTQGGEAAASEPAPDLTGRTRLDDTTRLRAGGHAGAGAPLAELVGGSPGERLFARGSANVAKARAHTVTVARIAPSGAGLSSLPAAIEEIAGARRPFVLVDLSDAGPLGAPDTVALQAARDAGREAGTTVVFTGAPANLRKGNSGLELFEDEAAAALRIAQEVADKVDVEGVSIRLAEHELAEERPVQRTAAFSAPSFDDEDDDDFPPGASAPSFDKTDKLKAPKFDASEAKTEERPAHRTAAFSVPSFDDDDDDEGPGGPTAHDTADVGLPDFAADAEEGSFEDTAKLQAPKFDKSPTEERPVHRTAAFSVPDFDDDEDEEAPSAEAPSFDKTDKLKVPSFDGPPDDEDRPAAQTAAFGVPDFDDEEEEGSFEDTAKISGLGKSITEERPVHRTAAFSVPSFDDDDEDEEGGPDASEVDTKADLGEAARQTAVFGAPDFDEGDDDDDVPFDETDKVSAPDFRSDDRPVHRTAAFSVPNFDDDDDDDATDTLGAEEDEAPPRQTSVFGAPDFDDDDEEGDAADTGSFEETDRVAAPDIAEERPSFRTAAFSVPSFDDDDDDGPPGDDEDEAPRPGGKTTVLSSPDFDDEDEAPRPGGKTTVLSSPDFDDEDEAPRPGGKTTVLSSPDFDDEDEAPRAGGKTTLLSSPDFDEMDHGETSRISAGSSKRKSTKSPEETDRLSEVDYGETDRVSLTELNAETRPINSDEVDQGIEEEVGRLFDEAFEDTAKLDKGASNLPDTGPLTPITKPGGPLTPATKEMRTAPPNDRPDLRGAKTEVMPGLSPEQARRMLAESGGVAAASAKAAAKAAPPPAAAPSKGGPPPAKKPGAKPGDFQMARTEAMDGLSREEAARQVAALQAGGPPPKKGGDLQTSQTDRMDSPSREQAQIRSAKTEAMPGLRRDEASKLMDKKTGEIPAKSKPPATVAAKPAMQESKGSKGPLVGILVASLALVVGGVWWSTRAPTTPVVTTNGSKPSTDTEKPPVDPRLADALKKLQAADKDLFGAFGGN